MLDQARSAGTVFTACLRLFRGYPLAVRRHYAEHRYGSMVLMSHAAGAARFHVLIMEWDDLFVIRPWDRRDGARVEIRPGESASGDVHRLITSSVPCPRDGALLGWVAGHQVRAVLLAHGRLPEPWDDPSAVPGILTLPLAGSQSAGRPPLAADLLDDPRLWEYVAQGQLADLAPVVSRRAGRVFLVPGAGDSNGLRTGDRVLVTERLGTADFWLPAGVYASQGTPRDGSQVLTASQLLALPGVTDLANGHPG